MIKYMPVILLLAGVFIFGSCKDKKTEPKDYVNVSAYLKGQLKYIDTVPFAFLKLVKKDSIFTDSQYITKEQVKNIINEFLVKELEKGNFEKNYKEISFADATIKMVTINYESIDKNNPVSRVDVYVNPDKERISQVYLVRSKGNSDSTITQQLLWKHNKNFLLVTSVSKKDQPEKTITEKIIWDDRPDEE